jgi:hypothetical protein
VAARSHDLPPPTDPRRQSIECPPVALQLLPSRSKYLNEFDSTLNLSSSIKLKSLSRCRDRGKLGFRALKRRSGSGDVGFRQSLTFAKRIISFTPRP